MLRAYSPRPPAGYDLYTFSKTGRPIPGDGLAILIQQGVPHAPLPLTSDLQAFAFRIQAAKLYSVCNIYVPPNDPVTPDQLTNLLVQLPPPFVLAGDFNARHQLWGDTLNNRLGDALEALVLTTDAVILNTGSSTHFHVQTSSFSAIDITLCSSAVQLDFEWSVHHDCCGSDHYPVLVREVPAVPPAGREPRFRFDKADWVLYGQLTYVPESTVFTMRRPVDDAIASFCAFLLDAADASIPKSSGRTPKRRVPWWTPDCTRACVERKRALRRYQRSGLMADRISYSRARAFAKHVQKQARRESWRRYISTITVDTPMDKIWARVKKMRGTYRRIPSPYLIEDGRHVTESREVAALLAEHYASVSSCDAYPADFCQLKLRAELSVLDFSTEVDFTYNSPFTLLELSSMLSRCRNTAPGEDNISYSMLKHCHATAQTVLLSLFNVVWKEVSFPEAWSSASVLSFNKPGKPSTNKRNLRPIALTSCVGKLLEKMVNCRLVLHLESLNLLPRYQFGFRKMHSTTDALIRVTSDILTAFTNKHSVVAVFFDMEKAYDKTWRYGILRTLHNFGLRGFLPLYIKNFLSRRTFRTKVGNIYSPAYVQEEGVPQGSVLSCTLFSIAINGILSVLPPDVRGSLYVDDFMIYCAGPRLAGLERKLQLAITRISRWALDRGFKFSTSKTTCVHFSRSRGLHPEPSLMLQGQPIMCRDSARFLGLILDSRLRWSEHVKDLKTRVTKRLAILKCLSHTTWGADRVMMMRLYHASVRSVIDYGCLLYGSASSACLRTLEPVHNSAIRLISGAFRSSPVVSLCAESGDPPLFIRRFQLHMQFFLRSSRFPASASFPYLQQPAPALVPKLNSLTFGQRTSSIIRVLNLQLPAVLPFTYSGCPVWELSSEVFCDGFSCPAKSDISPQHLKYLFLDHLHEKHYQDTPIYTDGSKTETGVGCAAVLGRRSSAKHLHLFSSIFTAELLALLTALSLIESSNNLSFVIFTDSRSVIQAVRHYDSCHPLVSEIVCFLIRLASRRKLIKLCWVPSHVLISGNEAADTAARNAAPLVMPPSNPLLPFRDLYPYVRNAVLSFWQADWTAVQGNKLRTIKPNVSPWASSNCSPRSHSRLLARLRIGHTFFSHGFLMERQHQPYCEDCLVPLTVKHVLAECPSLAAGRRRFFPSSIGLSPDETLSVMLAEKQNVPFTIVPLINFLEMYNYIHRI